MLRGIHFVQNDEFRRKLVLPDVKTEQIRKGHGEIDCKETNQLILQTIPDLCRRQVQSMTLIRNCGYDMVVWTLEGNRSISILAQANSYKALEQNNQGKQKRVISYRENPDYLGRNCGGFEVITAESEPIKLLTPSISLFDGDGHIVKGIKVEPHLEIWIRIVLSDESAVIIRSERSVSSLIVRVGEEQIEWDFKFIRKDPVYRNELAAQIEMDYGQVREAS